jgi:hypothetical protein
VLPGPLYLDGDWEALEAFAAWTGRLFLALPAAQMARAQVAADAGICVAVHGLDLAANLPPARDWLLLVGSEPHRELPAHLRARLRPVAWRCDPEVDRVAEVLAKARGYAPSTGRSLLAVVRGVKAVLGSAWDSLDIVRKVLSASVTVEEVGRVACGVLAEATRNVALVRGIVGAAFSVPEGVSCEPERVRSRVCLFWSVLDGAAVTQIACLLATRPETELVIEGRGDERLRRLLDSVSPSRVKLALDLDAYEPWAARWPKVEPRPTPPFDSRLASLLPRHALVNAARVIEALRPCDDVSLAVTLARVIRTHLDEDPADECARALGTALEVVAPVRWADVGAPPPVAVLHEFPRPSLAVLLWDGTWASPALSASVPGPWAPELLLAEQLCKRRVSFALLGEAVNLGRFLACLGESVPLLVPPVGDALAFLKEEVLERKEPCVLVFHDPRGGDADVARLLASGKLTRPQEDKLGALETVELNNISVIVCVRESSRFERLPEALVQLRIAAPGQECLEADLAAAAARVAPTIEESFIGVFRPVLDRVNLDTILRFSARTPSDARLLLLVEVRRMLSPQGTGDPGWELIEQFCESQEDLQAALEEFRAPGDSLICWDVSASGELQLRRQPLSFVREELVQVMLKVNRTAVPALALDFDVVTISRWMSVRHLLALPGGVVLRGPGGSGRTSLVRLATLAREWVFFDLDAGELDLEAVLAALGGRTTVVLSRDPGRFADLVALAGGNLRAFMPRGVGLRIRADLGLSSFDALRKRLVKFIRVVLIAPYEYPRVTGFNEFDFGRVTCADRHAIARFYVTDPLAAVLSHLPDALGEPALPRFRELCLRTRGQTAEAVADTGRAVAVLTKAREEADSLAADLAVRHEARGAQVSQEEETHRRLVAESVKLKETLEELKADMARQRGEAAVVRSEMDGLERRVSELGVVLDLAESRLMTQREHDEGTRESLARLLSELTGSAFPETDVDNHKVLHQLRGSEIRPGNVKRAKAVWQEMGEPELGTPAVEWAGAYYTLAEVSNELLSRRTAWRQVQAGLARAEASSAAQAAALGESLKGVESEAEEVRRRIDASEHMDGELAALDERFEELKLLVDGLSPEGFESEAVPAHPVQTAALLTYFGGKPESAWPGLVAGINDILGQHGIVGGPFSAGWEIATLSGMQIRSGVEFWHAFVKSVAKPVALVDPDGLVTEALGRVRVSVGDMEALARAAESGGLLLVEDVTKYSREVAALLAAVPRASAVLGRKVLVAGSFQVVFLCNVVPAELAERCTVVDLREADVAREALWSASVGHLAPVQEERREVLSRLAWAGLARALCEFDEGARSMEAVLAAKGEVLRWARPHEPVEEPPELARSFALWMALSRTLAGAGIQSLVSFSEFVAGDPLQVVQRRLPRKLALFVLFHAAARLAADFSPSTMVEVTEHVRSEYDGVADLTVAELRQAEFWQMRFANVADFYRIMSVCVARQWGSVEFPRPTLEAGFYLVDPREADALVDFLAAVGVGVGEAVTLVGVVTAAEVLAVSKKIVVLFGDFPKMEPQPGLRLILVSSGPLPAKVARKFRWLALDSLEIDDGSTIGRLRLAHFVGRAGLPTRVGAPCAAAAVHPQLTLAASFSGFSARKFAGLAEPGSEWPRDPLRGLTQWAASRWAAQPFLGAGGALLNYLGGQQTGAVLQALLPLPVLDEVRVATPLGVFVAGEIREFNERMDLFARVLAAGACAPTQWRAVLGGGPRRAVAIVSWLRSRREQLVQMAASGIGRASPVDLGLFTSPARLVSAWRADISFRGGARGLGSCLRMTIGSSDDDGGGGGGPVMRISGLWLVGANFSTLNQCFEPVNAKTPAFTRLQEVRLELVPELPESTTGESYLCPVLAELGEDVPIFEAPLATTVDPRALAANGVCLAATIGQQFGAV